MFLDLQESDSRHQGPLMRPRLQVQLHGVFIFLEMRHGLLVRCCNKTRVFCRVQMLWSKSIDAWWRCRGRKKNKGQKCVGNPRLPTRSQSEWMLSAERKLDAARWEVAVDTRPLCLTPSTPHGNTQHDAPTAIAHSAALPEVGLDQCHPRLHLVRPSSRRGRAHNRYARPPTSTYNSIRQQLTDARIQMARRSQ